MRKILRKKKKPKAATVIRNLINLKKPVFKNQVAQEIVDEFIIITYETLKNHIETPRQDYKLDDSRINAMIDKINSIGESDANQVLDYVRTIIDQFR
ncbi:MAG: hypothetical protein LBV03_07620 [Fusobacteriales bacterium]|jgi:hypothetical protein|nr:hypothetical protein [Fusobacteriales bacterium]